jgi:hypothetical protein
MKSLALAVALFLLPACSQPRVHPFRIHAGGPASGKVARHDYSTLAPIPNVPTDAVYRAIQMSVPYTRKRAFYGNWAGSGCLGGKPVDAMDELFRRHDIAYAESDTLRSMRRADAACIEALYQLPESQFTPAALKFRKRAADFFTTPAFALIGKPWRVFVLWRETADCPLRTEAEMRAFFGLTAERSK